MFTIHTYFCPSCGKGLESKDCQDDITSSISSSKCPECNVKVEISGAACIIASFLIFVFSSMVMCCGAEQWSLLFSAPFFGLGIVRSIRQLSIRFRYNRVDQP